MEIERKFLLTSLPDVSSAKQRVIKQGYLAIDGKVEVRLRDDNGALELTVKGGSGQSRSEETLTPSREQFDSLWVLTDGRQVNKTRYELPIGDLTAEVDVYEGDLDGLLTAEVEFASEDAANAFQAPDWLGADVTGDKRYANQRLATDGKP